MSSSPPSPFSMNLDLVQAIGFIVKIYNECFLSINEKRILNPDYLPGSDILFEPWLITTLGINSIAYVARPLEGVNILFIASSLFKKAELF